MNFFKKRPIAIILCVVAVLCSTLLNTRFKLGADCAELEALFYRSGGIASQLEILHENANALAAVSDSNGIDASALRSASDNLQGLLSQRGIGAGLIYTAYDKLRTELSATRQKLLSAELSQQDSVTANNCLDALDSAKSALSQSEYNELVRSFRADNGSFFTRFWASLAFVNMPEEFA